MWVIYVQNNVNIYFAKFYMKMDAVKYSLSLKSTHLDESIYEEYLLFHLAMGAAVHKMNSLDHCTW